MIQLEFSPETIEQLQYQKRYHPHPRVRQKMEALYLKSLGMPHHQISQLVGIRGRATLVRYLRDYQKGGLEQLQKLRFRKPESILVQYRDKIEEAIADKPPATINEARHRIEQTTGIKRSNPSVYRFLKKTIGLNRYKTGSIPVQQTDPERQEEQKTFIEQKLDPRLEEMKAGRREVFFVDAAHFVWAAFLGYLWFWNRLFVSAPSGRKRFNVLGAINARTHQVMTVTNNSYINADSVCELLLAIAEAGFQVPVTLIMDNAKYQHAKVVKELASKLGIELLYLPAYSPNLNLIERLWKFVKKKCLYSEYYESFDLFCGAIQGCLSKVGNNEYQAELKTLLSLKFQTFKKVQFVMH